MKPSTFVIHVCCFLQLVYVIAGNDVITFNQEVFDEDNINTALETEHFIQVVDRRNNKPPHNIALKTPYRYEHASPDIPSQGSKPKDYRDTIQTQTTSHPSNSTFSKLSRTTSESWAPVHWENMSTLSKAGNSEDDLLEIDELFLAKDQNSDFSLSRHKRAAPNSGDAETNGVFNITEAGRSRRASSIDHNAVAKSLTNYLENYFRDARIAAFVSDIVGKTVYFDIRYDMDAITPKDIARALSELENGKNLIVGSISYSVTQAMLTSSVTNVLEAVMCFLCSSYQKCQQGLNLNFLCKLLDTRFYSFGTDRFDKAVPPGGEFDTVHLQLEFAIPFERELVRNIYISPNGLISFEEPFASYTPVPCPVYHPYNSNRRRRKLLAPYWTDMDKVLGDRGDVFYQVYTQNARSRPIDLQVLRSATRDVMRYSNERDFEATIAIVITWSDMPAYPVRKSNNERVTFQAVIISNGETSYVIYQYAQGAMQLNPYLSRQVQVCVNGITLDLSRNNFYQFDRIIGNTGNIGQWIYKLGYVPNYGAKCYQWFQSNIPMLNAIQFWNQIVPACPCNEFTARWSFQWIPSYRQFGCYESFPQFGQIGRRCCYTQWGSFENRIPLAGNLQMYTPYSYFSLANHEREDAIPKDWCCYRSNNCQLYYIARPVQSCEPRFTWRGFFFGDPHFSTLDKKKIIFNGLGEYRLLEVNATVKNISVDFRLQGRTCRAKGSDGKLSNATIFCALALLNTNNTKAHVSIDPSEKYMIIYINNQDFTVRFRDNANYNESVGGMFIKKMNESLVISTPDNIGVTITLADNLLDFTVEIGVEYKNTTKGLLGNFNENDSDDLIFPNGTTLPNTSSERRIFEYCQTWAVKESIFNYGPGENSSTHSDPTFVPIFLDEENATTINEAKQICGPSNQACIYDYIATGNKQLAINTKDADEEYIKEEKTISNNPPNINGSNMIQVTVNVSSTITMTGSDPDNDKFYFVIVNRPNSGNFTYTNSSSNLTVSYTPINMDTVSIEVAAEDDQGLRSDITKVFIVACSGCSYNGSCDFDNQMNTTDPYFSIAKCVCNQGYSGEDCEKDTDGCDIGPCPEGTTCTDVPAPEELQTNKSYNCSSCPAGYHLDTNGTKCEDIDECNSTSNSNICGANAYCNNTIGSYTCTCVKGFRSSGGRCVDINECVENQHDCKQICYNRIPPDPDKGYECDCYDGFNLSTDGFNCTLTDIHPCENLTHKNCSTGCRNNSGEAECFCETGYRLKPDGYSCEDIDECEENLCSQACTNTNGSYSCSCFKGYQLSDDKLSCVFCPDNKYGDGCMLDCTCRGNAKRCDPVQGCICTDGWTGPHCEQDVDECAAIVSPCAKDKFCSNTNGSFICECPTGYQDINGSCTNINECLDASVHNCSQLCIDNPGSFTCACRPGYNADGNKCVDIDECALGISGCDQICQNMEGSYNCDCHRGFVLDSDRKNCFKAKDPCQDFNVTCGYACDVVNFSPQCFCQIGYMLGTDNKTCIDINECTSGLHNCTEGCINFEGSYNCSCSAGTKLANDRRTCEACDGFHWGPNCDNVCDCDPVGTDICHRTEGCKCKIGWRGQKCSIDVDECSSDVSVCPDLSYCNNTPGSFVCMCKDGFFLENNTCKDINECMSIQPCDHECTNTIGSYICSCFKGFYPVGDKCIDIDECTMPQLSKCDQNCRNTQGGFACECYEGYILNTTTRNTCYRDPLAKDCGKAKNCTHECAFEDGQETCFCLPGFELENDNSTCKDIDECQPTNPCVNGTCNNLNGSFACNCTDGENLAVDERTCQACTFWKYGKDCNNSCLCNVTNTATCVASNGMCECNNGWNGTTCSDDIDECLDLSTNKCGNNSQCENTPGSHKCVCSIGFFPTSDGDCIPCDDTHYGQDCSSVCNCAIANTQDCNDINGTCACKQGWTGTNCDVDVDECKENSSYCGPLEDCNNLNGSAECLCKTGYNRPNPSSPCQDINECLVASLHNCTDPRECNNTVGAFECVCKKGYLEINGQCQDIDECLNATLNNCNNDSSTCKNIPGGFQCVCIDGYEKDSKGECVDINECLVASLNNCTDPRECKNTDGAFECVCKKGYEEINGQCQDIDECLNATLNNCNNASSECKNIPGGFQCVCIDGYEKDSKGECVDINECLVASLHNCTDPRECKNTDGAFECVCKNGYEEINGQCQDIDECLNATLNNCNNDSSTCKNIPGGFQCVCKHGYHVDSTGRCSKGKEFPVQITFLYDESQMKTISNKTFNNSTDDFRNFAKLVEEALLKYGKDFINDTLLDVKVIEFRRGSIIADTYFYIAETSKNPLRDVALVLDSLYYCNASIKINNTEVLVGNVTTDNCNLCDSVLVPNDACSADSQKPAIKCKPCAENKDNLRNKDNLIIGLAVGIPLFVILTAVVALLAYLYVRRKRNSQEQSSSQSVDHASQFRNVVATRASTKGSWGAPHQMYAPDNFSDTGTNESGNGGLIKTRQKGRSDFQDSAWFDNRGATPSGLPESREASTETGGPMSNFSWEYMFRLLEPHRDFEIQRPYYETAPNPTFIPKNQ